MHDEASRRHRVFEPEPQVPETDHKERRTTHERWPRGDCRRAAAHARVDVFPWNLRARELS